MKGLATFAVMMTAAICVAADPATRTADLPDSWLVLYNVNVTDSVTWAQWYASQRGIPAEQVLGLNASASEHLADAAAAEAQIFAPVRQFLAANPAIAARVMGIIVGYRVPGHFGAADYGIGGYSVACALQDPADTTINVNPDYPQRWGDVLPVDGRLTKARMTPGHYMVGRIDGPTLDAAMALTNRALAIRMLRNGIAGNFVYYDYADAQKGTWWVLKQTVENPMFEEIPWCSFDDDTQQTPLDAFRFAWHDVANWHNARLRGAPAGVRILAYDYNSWGATTVRSITAENGRFVPNALDAGYAAAVGATGEPRFLSAPYPDTMLGALMAGGTLGEAFYLSNPYDDFMWEVIGDPLLKVGGWAPIPGTSITDFDQDLDVDLSDLDLLQACMNGPNRPFAPGCGITDLDEDGDVDVTDYSRFLRCFNGPNLPPAPGCPY